MASSLSEGLYAFHAFTIALCGERELCDPLVDVLRADPRLAEAGVSYRPDSGQFAALVARHRDIAAAVIVWSDADGEALVELVASVRRHQANPMMPVLVRSVAPLAAEVRARLRSLGVHGPYCRDGTGVETLAEDLLFAVETMHEKQALVALSALADDKAGSLPELAAAALAFLHRNGIGGQGGLFCFLRPTSRPEWLAVAGTGRYGAAACEPVATFAPAIAGHVEGAAEAEEEDGGRRLLLPFVTPGGSRFCLHLAQQQPLMPWHRVILDIFRDRLALLVDELLLKRRIECMHHATMATLATLAEYKDVDTGNHVSRVSRITTEVAQILADAGALPADTAHLLVRHIGHASILHDIGKVGIPDRILLKPGALDPEERHMIERHTALGHEILSKTALISDSPALMRLAADVARSHHERWDGKGYPDGLAGEAIPLAARIVAVVDVYDALTGERPYKKPWPEEKAIGLICDQAGQHFDPRVVEAFLAAMERKKDGFSVAWTPAFSVGDDGIDEDHRKLFGILNQIWLAKETGNRQIVEMALDDLMHYTQSHFRREEEYMSAFGYPEYVGHRQSHAAFAEHIEALRWEYLHGLRRDIHIELLEYLSDWLMSHIAQSDMQYSRFVEALGGMLPQEAAVFAGRA